MRVPPEVGANRTGTGTAPAESKKAIEGARDAAPSAPGDASALAAVRAAYIQIGEPLGLMPPPGGGLRAVDGGNGGAAAGGAAATGAGGAAGRRPTVLLDRLGERLAFERMGTRLFEALITKYEAAVTETAPAEGPSVTELRAMHDEELAHFELLQRTVESLGADPTVQTPSADLAALAIAGVVQIVVDPRTTPTQSLQGVLVAELVDHDGWRQLVELADALGHRSMADDFRRALLAEERHLAHVRRWLAAALREQAGAPGSVPPAR